MAACIFLASCGPVTLKDEANLDRAIVNHDRETIIRYARNGDHRALVALRSYPGDPAVIEGLLFIAEGGFDFNTRGRAVGLLSYHFDHSGEASRRLLHYVRNGRSPMAEAILGEVDANRDLSDRDRKNILLAASRHDNPVIRVRAASGLKKIGAPEATDLLFTLLSSDIEYVQEGALKNLAGITDDRFAPRIRQLLVSPSSAVRKSAMKAAESYGELQDLLVYPADSMEDVDDDLSREIANLERTRTDRNKWLFAVGIGAYADAPRVSFSSNSTRAFADVVRLKLGVPDDQAMVLLDRHATGTRIRSSLATFLNRVQRGDTVYFYYSGHGLPSRNGGAAYVLPQDGVVGSYEDPEFRLDTIMERFAKSRAGRVVAFIDSCFSGKSGARELVFPGVAPILRAPRHNFDRNKTTLFLAGNSEQFSNAHQARGHRMFTYFLAKGILGGRTDVADLESFVRDQVSRESRKLGVSFSQDPYVDGDAGIRL